MNARAAPGAALMRLGELVPGCAAHADIAVSGLCADSRAVMPGDVFIALLGDRYDGLAHIAQAASRGAVAILVDAGRDFPSEAPLPLISVEGLAANLGAITAHFYGHPSRNLDVIGVTGTNGKTTCTQLLAQALSHAKRPCGVIGTLGSGFPGQLRDTTHTTPDAVTLQRLLAELRSGGAEAVAMEVSSHALAQGRVAAVQFATAVFTNLTHDHLDFHGSIEAYAAAKAELFRHPGLRNAVLNLDDPFGRHLLASLPGAVTRMGFTLGAEAADLRVQSADYRADGIRARVATPQGDADLVLPLIGRFNLQNALAVLGVLLMHGISLQSAVGALAAVSPVPGRMERVDAVAGPLVIVDYAHTPDALEQALRALRQHCRGRLWCVFGCGGDRDRSKRPLMGRLAREHADEIVVTSDNPRSESPQSIISEICAGIPDPGVIREADRRAAIFRAVRDAGPLDCVLIAGKGHENYQETQGVRTPFSDVLTAREALAARGGEA